MSSIESTESIGAVTPPKTRGGISTPVSIGSAGEEEESSGSETSESEEEEGDVTKRTPEKIKSQTLLDKLSMSDEVIIVIFAIIALIVIAYAISGLFDTRTFQRLFSLRAKPAGQ